LGSIGSYFKIRNIISICQIEKKQILGKKKNKKITIEHFYSIALGLFKHNKSRKTESTEFLIEGV
jgi:hypothetical protein